MPTVSDLLTKVAIVSTSPLVGAVRVSHHYVSTVIEVSAEHAAVALDRLIREGRVAGGAWQDPVANEAPWGVAYWPRLTVPGHLRVGGRDHRVELEVWPWDDRRAEVGLRPAAMAGAAPAREPWVAVAASTLGHVVQGMARTRSRAMHPAAFGRRTAAGNFGA